MLTDYCITPFSRATTCKTLRMKVAKRNALLNPNIAACDYCSNSPESPKIT